MGKRVCEITCLRTTGCYHRWAWYSSFFPPKRFRINIINLCPNFLSYHFILVYRTIFTSLEPVPSSKLAGVCWYACTSPSFVHISFVRIYPSYTFVLVSF